MGEKVVALCVVLDTNVLVSALLFGGSPGKLRDLWVGGRLIPLVSKATFDEFSKVLTYPKFRLTSVEVSQIVEEELLPFAEIIEVTEDAGGTCRDPHDDMFLALAASGGASFIVTGDKDLLALTTFRETRIVTVSEFLKLI